MTGNSPVVYTIPEPYRPNAAQLLMLLAAKPPRILTKIYLALERAAALVLGFAMALAGAAVVFRDRTADTIIAAEAQATEANETGHEGEL